MSNSRRPSPRREEPPPRQPPATTAARNARQGMQAKGPVPGPHARTPAPTARGQRTPTACPKDGRPGEGDAPHEGTRHPPKGRPPATPTSRSASLQERAQGAPCRAPIPAPPAPGEQGQRTATACPKDGQPGEGERLTLDAPHAGEGSPPGQPPATPAARNVRQGMQAKGLVPGPHVRTPSPTACGQRTATACPKDGQPGEGERLAPDAPHEGTRHPPRGRPPGTPTARNASSQEFVLWDW